MGGRGAYSQKKGGFVVQEWKKVGEIEGFKVIYNSKKPNSSAPKMSAKANTTYLIQNKQGYIREIAIYGAHKELEKTIHVSHGHGDVPRGVAHIHHHRGGREANVTRLNRKEAKKYGTIVTGVMGGKLQ